ncbi:PREDICTED: uncharacterized protein LOC104815716 isoform X1 [Tarenaya hassleriana]|uniref:uncharacterized protein LOC104815716 isoform X1 n=1 Tax=Tarenaya hassleriana TaxID=28532 RepID=UPI00053C8553|nr:PREDICTED: uncharacterized protein LOC104815716 isoform X1 [Tarenaya hassleriana]
MLKQWSPSSSSSSQLLYLNSSKSNPRRNTPRFNPARYPRKPGGRLTCILKVGFEDVVEIINNKVIIAAGVSAAVGQLSKPFTSVFFYGKDLDFRTAFQAGGFPSTHSSSVVAAATALALERGFADSIFGITVVYAGLTMYDAQGVRREVGNHARVLNKLPFDAKVDSQMRTTMVKSRRKSMAAQVQTLDEMDKDDPSSPLLKESIGHTEVEVVAGALLGFFVSLAVSAIL